MALKAGVELTQRREDAKKTALALPLGLRAFA
jgi:hypothetical protein